MAGRRKRGAGGISPLVWSLLAAAASLTLFLPGIGGPDFVGDDAALDAAVVQEMAVRGDWFFPEFNGGEIPPKPPLFYWTAALISSAMGVVDETSVRLPSALSGAVLVGLTAAIGAHVASTGVGVLAGVLLAIMPVVHDQARTGRPDMLMALLVTGALGLFLVSADPLTKPRRWAFFALLGLAVMAKAAAPVGLAVFVLLAGALAARRFRGLAALVDPAVVAFFVLAGAWYAMGLWKWGDRFFTEHLVGENLRHFFGGLDAGPQGPSEPLDFLRHFLNLFGGTAPFGLLLPLALWRSGRRDASPERRFLAAWVVAGLVFFTLAARKSPYYLLPLMPAAAILVAIEVWPRVVEAWEERGAAGFRPGAEALLGIMALGICFPLWWWGLGAPGLRAGEPEALRRVAEEAPIRTGLAIAAIGAFGAVAIASALRRSFGKAAVHGIATMVVFFLILDGIDPRVSNAASLRPFAERLPHPSEPLYFYRYRLPAVVFYSGRHIPVASPDEWPEDPQFWLIVPESLAPEILSPREIVHSHRGRVFTSNRMDLHLMFIEPSEDPL